jgi:hypothetical protein
MTKRTTATKTGKRKAPVTAGELRAPVVIVIIAVLAALAILLKHYR